MSDKKSNKPTKATIKKYVDSSDDESDYDTTSEISSANENENVSIEKEKEHDTINNSVNANKEQESTNLNKTDKNLEDSTSTEAKERVAPENLVENDSKAIKKQKQKHTSENNNDSTSASASASSIKSPDRGAQRSRQPPPPEERYFGYGKFKPKFLQKFCTAKWALFWLCWAGAMQGLIVNGFINVVITTIERRFGLRSKQTGLVASGYDIASFLSLVPVTYFGGRLNALKTKWIAWGVILMGLGSLTFSLPHFLVNPYRIVATSLDICLRDQNRTDAVNARDNCAGAIADEENHQWAMWFFFVAQLCHGAGASPLYTLGVTFIDDNVKKSMSSVYIGIFYTMAILGPAVGYLIGGQLLLIYTDFLTVDSSDLTITTESKIWIGAWWIGFVFSALACCLLSIPIFGYPKNLPGHEELKSAKSSEAYNDDSQVTIKEFDKAHEIPKALLALLKNPTFVFLSLAGASEGLVVAGFATFLPKQMENQFHISPVWAALVVGLVTVPAGGGGTFIGGYLVKKINLNCAGIIKLCLFVTIVAGVFTLTLLLRCPNLKYAGITTKFSRNLTDENISSTVACNEDCYCSKRDYNPICGADDLMYLSPCVAGCTIETKLGNNKIYKNCSCIVTNHSSHFKEYDAINNMCETKCKLMRFFVVLCFVMMLFTFLASMPALSATLRCLRDDQRSFGLGIQWITVRLLGTIPAPMIFGTLIDKTCILWQDSCDDAIGSCLVYDNKSISWSMFALALTAKSCSTIFFFSAWWFYIPPKKVSDVKPSNSDEEIEIGIVKFADPNTNQTLE